MTMLGSKYPIVIVSYRNCEICSCHLDGYKENTEALLDRMREIEIAFSSKPAHAKYRIWYNLDENKLNPFVMQAIVESVCRIHGHIYKIAFVGLHGMHRYRFDRLLRQVLKKATLCREYFTDAELAKDWLV